jgi:WD40 repeat protein
MGRVKSDHPEPTQCPTEEELAVFAESPAVNAKVLAHLDGCADCRFLISALATPSVPSESASADEIRGRPATPHYKLAGVAGVGGMGTVYEALDLRVGRTVALKVLHDGPEDRLGRFLREARITAQLDHPSIVAVHEIGELDDGTPYYTQRLVRGETLASALAHCPGLPQRLKLLAHFLELCQAIAYAHKHGFIHRDIKPGNVLVGEFGVTTVVDWGLARPIADREQPATGSAAEGAPDQTIEGRAVGTPAYMSPEQARGDLAAVDERSDVWSLGAVLHELLSGTPPYSGTTGEVLAKVLAGPPGALRESAPRELVAIATKAMSRAPRDRYPSAGELAAEVSAYMSGERVGTYEYSSIELLRRLVVSHRATSAAIAAALVLGALWGVQLTRAARELRNDYAHQMLGNAVRYGRVQQWDRTAVYFATARVSEESSEARLGQVAIEGFALRPVWRAVRHESAVLAIAFSGDSALLATADHAGSVAVSDADTGELLRKIPGEPVSAVTFTGGDVLAIASGTRIRLCLARTGTELYTLDARANVLALSRDADGHRLAAATDAGIRLWDLPSRTALADPASGPVSSLDWSQGTLYWAAGPRGVGRLATDGGALSPLSPISWPGLDAVEVRAAAGKVLVRSRNGELNLWDPALGAEPLRLPSIATRPFVLSSIAAAGSLLGTVDAAGFPQLFDAETQRPVSAIATPMRPITAVAWAPSAARIAWGRADGQVAIWDASGSIDAAGARGLPAGNPTALAFAPDGQMVASTDDGGRVRLWGRTGKAAPVLLGTHAGRANHLAFAPTAGKLATAGADGVRLWDTTARAPLGLLSTAPTTALSWDRGDRFLASASGGDVRFIPFKGAAPAALHQETEIFALALSGDGALLASGGADRIVRVWELGRGGPPRTLFGHTDKITSLAFLADGRLVSGSVDRTVRIWNLATGQSDPFGGNIEGEVRSIAAATSRDAPFPNAILSGTDRGLIDLWDASDGRRIFEVPLPATSAANAVAFSADGATAAWMLSDGGLHFLSLHDAEKLGSPASELARLLRLYQLKWDQGELVRDDERMR